MSAELKPSFFYSAFGVQPPALLLNLRWEISAGQLFELMLPASFALTALLSAWVLASARRRRLQAPAVTLWTLGTLFFPLIVLPLYLIARLFARPPEKEREDEQAAPTENQPTEKSASRIPLRRTLPLAYLLVMLALGALYFRLESSSVDAHLARANQARVRYEREQVIEEYRAALRLEDDAHTHNLLGQELAAALRWEEALSEFRTAERMGEADDELSYNIALALDQLKRPAEAKPAYERFLNSSLCVEMPHDVRCGVAVQRLKELAKR